MLNASKNSIKLFILGNRSQSQRNCCKYDTWRQTILNYGKDTSSFHSSSRVSVTSLRKGRGKKNKKQTHVGKGAGLQEHTRDAGTEEEILQRKIPSEKFRSCPAGKTHYRINLLFQVILQALELIFPLLLKQKLCLTLLQGIHHTTHSTTQCLQNKTVNCRRDWNSGLLKPQSSVHELFLKRVARYFISILAIRSKPDSQNYNHNTT